MIAGSAAEYVGITEVHQLQLIENDPQPDINVINNNIVNITNDIDNLQDADLSLTARIVQLEACCQDLTARIEALEGASGASRVIIDRTADGISPAASGDVWFLNLESVEAAQRAADALNNDYTDVTITFTIDGELYEFGHGLSEDRASVVGDIDTISTLGSNLRIEVPFVDSLPDTLDMFARYRFLTRDRINQASDSFAIYGTPRARF